MVERSNGPSHACNSSNLSVWVRQYPVFFVVGRVHRPRQSAESRDQRAGRRTERSVIPSHLRFPIPDRGPTSGHLGVGLSPPLATWFVVDYLLIQSQTTRVCRLQYFCGLDFLSSTQTQARTHTRHIGPSSEAASPAQPPAYYILIFTCPLALPISGSPPLLRPPFALLSKHAAESRRSAA